MMRRFDASTTPSRSASIAPPMHESALTDLGPAASPAGPFYRRRHAPVKRQISLIILALFSAGVTAQEAMPPKERSERRLIQEVKDSRPVKIRIPGKPALSPKGCEDSGGRLVFD